MCIFQVRIKEHVPLLGPATLATATRNVALRYKYCKKLEANLRQVLQPPTGLKRPFSHPPLTFDPQIHHTVCDTGVSDTVIISNHQH